MENYLNSFNAVLSWIKAFKYLKLSPSLNQVIAMLGYAKTDLIAFTFIFMIVYVGFAQAYYLAFSQMESYSTFPTAFISLFREILGDFDYKSREEENWILAPIFFIAFVCLIVLVLMFIAIAILEKGYASVQEEIADIEERGEEDKLFAKVSRSTLRWTNSVKERFGKQKTMVKKDRDHMIEQLRRAHKKSEADLNKFIKFARRKSKHWYELEAALEEMARSDAEKTLKLEEEASKRAVTHKSKAREAIEAAFQRRQAESDMRKKFQNDKVENEVMVTKLEGRITKVGELLTQVIASGSLNPKLKATKTKSSLNVYGIGNPYMRGSSNYGASVGLSGISKDYMSIYSSKSKPRH